MKKTIFAFSLMFLACSSSPELITESIPEKSHIAKWSSDGNTLALYFNQSLNIYRYENRTLILVHQSRVENRISDILFINNELIFRDSISGQLFLMDYAADKAAKINYDDINPPSEIIYDSSSNYSLLFSYTHVYLMNMQNHSIEDRFLHGKFTSYSPNIKAVLFNRYLYTYTRSEEKLVRTADNETLYYKKTARTNRFSDSSRPDDGFCASQILSLKNDNLQNYGIEGFINYADSADGRFLYIYNGRVPFNSNVLCDRVHCSPVPAPTERGCILFTSPLSILALPSLTKHHFLGPKSYYPLIIYDNMMKRTVYVLYQPETSHIVNIVPNSKENLFISLDNTGNYHLWNVSDLTD